MEKAGVEEPGSRKVAQISEASLRADMGEWKVSHPLEPSRHHPSQLPQPSLALPPSPTQGDNTTHQLPKAKAPTPSLPKEAPTPPKLEAGVLGVPKERLLLPLPTAPGTGVLCPKVGAGVPGKQHATMSRGQERRKSPAWGSRWHLQEAQISLRGLKHRSPLGPASSPEKPF